MDFIEAGENWFKLVDAVKNAGLWAVELLISLTVFVGELDGKFEMRTVKTSVSIDRTAASAKDTGEDGPSRRKKGHASAARGFL
jgi:hypothetical protein